MNRWQVVGNLLKILQLLLKYLIMQQRQSAGQMKGKGTLSITVSFVETGIRLKKKIQIVSFIFFNNSSDHYAEFISVCI